MAQTTSRKDLFQGRHREEGASQDLQDVKESFPEAQAPEGDDQEVQSLGGGPIQGHLQIKSHCHLNEDHSQDLLKDQLDHLFIQKRMPRFVNQRLLRRSFLGRLSEKDLHGDLSHLLRRGGL